jgi:hypothetical protein
MAELLEDQGEDQEEDDKEDRNYVFLDDDEDDDSLVSNEDPFLFPNNNPTQTLDATELPRIEA